VGAFVRAQDLKLVPFDQRPTQQLLRFVYLNSDPSELFERLGGEVKRDVATAPTPAQHLANVTKYVETIGLQSLLK
jgi:hypothetical protein